MTKRGASTVGVALSKLRGYAIAGGTKSNSWATDDFIASVR